MSITVETCGKSYCEHYPEGLFACAKCREASTLAHDKACAKIAEARADADHWKSECNALQRMVHKAWAEIERKDKLIEQMRSAFERISGAAWRIKLAQGNSACSCESLNAADIIAWSSEHRKAALSAAERGE